MTIDEHEGLPVLLSRWEAARLLGVGPQYLDVLRRQGKLGDAVVQLRGGRFRYRTKVLLEYLELR